MHVEKKNKVILLRKEWENGMKDLDKGTACIKGTNLIKQQCAEVVENKVFLIPL